MFKSLWRGRPGAGWWGGWVGRGGGRAGAGWVGEGRGSVSLNYFRMLKVLIIKFL